MFGNPETTPGGRALKFYASVRLDIRRDRDDQDRHRMRSATGSGSRSSRTRSRRRSGSPSSTSCTARGSRKEGGLLDVGVAMDVVTKTGAWFTFGETRLGQGREASKEFLKREPGDRRRDRPPHPRPDRRGRGPGRGHRRGRVGRRSPGEPAQRDRRRRPAASRTPSDGPRRAADRRSRRSSWRPRSASSRRGRAP